jgi:hypothetical protein
MLYGMAAAAAFIHDCEGRAGPKGPVTHARVHERLNSMQWNILERRIREMDASGVISLGTGAGTYYMQLTDATKKRLANCGFVVTDNRKFAAFIGSAALRNNEKKQEGDANGA